MNTSIDKSPNKYRLSESEIINEDHAGENRNIETPKFEAKKKMKLGVA